MSYRTFTAMFAAALFAGAGTAMAQEAMPSDLTDEEVAHVAVTANTIDIESGRLAQDKAQNEQVRQFAALMVADHSASNQQAEKLVDSLGVEPKENDVSTSLEDEAEQAKDNLEKQEGAAFDRAYMQREVVFHQTVLTSLDDLLIPTTENAQLKELLTTVRGVVERHLERAKEINNQLAP
jgi:putative membrane protein